MTALKEECVHLTFVDPQLLEWRTHSIGRSGVWSVPEVSDGPRLLGI